MRRRLTDEERQGSLFDGAPQVTWPVVHPVVLPAKPEPLLSSTSDETGGPLNAIEAGRVMSGHSIRFAGHVFQKGLLHCRSCADWAKWPEGDPGFRKTIYSGTPHDQVIGRCSQCGVDVLGEDPRAASRSA